jgi:hypothetical protein
MADTKDKLPKASRAALAKNLTKDERKLLIVALHTLRGEKLPAGSEKMTREAARNLLKKYGYSDEQITNFEK